MRRTIRTPGPNYAWVRARLSRWQDEHLGPAGAAALGLRLQGEEPRRLRRGLADLLQGHRALLRPRRPLPRDLRRQGEPAVSAGQHFPAADPAGERRSHAARVAQEDEPGPDALPRRRHHRRTETQQVPQPLLRPRRVQPPCRRLRHPRRLRLADRPDLSGDGYRKSDAADQRDRARNSRRQEDRQGARRRVHRFGDRAAVRGAGEGGRRGGVYSRVGAAAAPVEVRRTPERHRQLEQSRRP